MEEKIATSREKPSERKEIYEKELYDRWYERLLKYWVQMVRAIFPEVVARQELLEKERRESRVRDRRMMRISITSILIGLVGAFIGVISVILI